MLKFDTPTLITLTAPTCSGKSFLLNELSKRGLAGRIVSTTTRPQRKGELSGVDYHFISQDQSENMERHDEFFEMIEFNGTRYGVTHDEMNKKMASSLPPIVVLEPQGLAIYRRECQAQGWNTFQIYVNVTESVRVQRLVDRTLRDVWSEVEASWGGTPSHFAKYGNAFSDVAKETLKSRMPNIINTHTSRLQSIVGDERRWSNMFSWDAIVPGDDVEKAIWMIEQGVKWRNHRNAEPQPIGRVTLPL